MSALERRVTKSLHREERWVAAQPTASSRRSLGPEARCHAASQRAVLLPGSPRCSSTASNCNNARPERPDPLFAKMLQEPRPVARDQRDDDLPLPGLELSRPAEVQGYDPGHR